MIRLEAKGGGTPPAARRRLATALRVAAAGWLLIAPSRARAQGAPTPPVDQITPAATASPPVSAPPSPPEKNKPTEVAPPPTPTRPAPNPTGSFGRVPNTAQLSAAAMSRGKGASIAWDPSWPTFRTAEYYATGGGIALALASQIARPRAKHWRGGILFDEAVRDAVRPGAYYGRQTAEDISDVTLSLAVSYPTVVDALGVAWWYRGSDKVAAQMALINAEVIAVTTGLHTVTTVFGSRERPYGRTCGAELDALSEDCTGSNRYRSYFSGHAAVAFAGSMSNCMHHAYLPLYGGGTPDAVVCAGGLAVAGATAFLRVVGDRHYATDVLSGSLMGSATGFLIPWLLHYRGGATRPAEAKQNRGINLYPFASPGLVGVGGTLP